MTLQGWNPLVLLPAAFVVVFIVMAARAVRRGRQRKSGH